MSVKYFKRTVAHPTNWELVVLIYKEDDSGFYRYFINGGWKKCYANLHKSATQITKEEAFIEIL